MPARKQAQPDTVSRFKVDGKDYEVDMAKLSFGEIAEVEEHFDKDFDSLHKAQDLIASLYLAMKRAKPRTTWEDVEALTSDAFEDVTAERPTSTPATSGTQAG